MSYKVKYPRYVRRVNKFVGSMFNRGPPSLGQVASGVGKAISIATKLAKAINSEKKYFDDSYVMTSVPLATPIIRHITAIPGGSGAGQRVGISISLNKMVSKHVISWNNHGITTGTVIMRRILFIDKNNNSATPPSISNVLQSVATPLETIMSPLNMNMRERFKVLRDDLYFRDSGKEMFEIKEVIPFKLKKDMRGNRTEAQHVTWSSSGPTTTQKGHLYEIWASYQSGTGLSDPSVGGNNRVRYYDN